MSVFYWYSSDRPFTCDECRNEIPAGERRAAVPGSGEVICANCAGKRGSPKEIDPSAVRLRYVYLTQRITLKVTDGNYSVEHAFEVGKQPTLGDILRALGVLGYRLAGWTQRAIQDEGIDVENDARMVDVQEKKPNVSGHPDWL